MIDGGVQEGRPAGLKHVGVRPPLQQQLQHIQLPIAHRAVEGVALEAWALEFQGVRASGVLGLQGVRAFAVEGVALEVWSVRAFAVEGVALEVWVLGSSSHNGLD
eukprot:361729-Pyramimonas_sp.AAC.1